MVSQALSQSVPDLIYQRTVLENQWIPVRPTEKQEEFLRTSSTQEVLFGGAAGGGKSVALLMAALQFVDDPDYNALIIRRTYADLAKPGALMDRAASWLSGTGARWHSMEHAWHFPSGASLSFGYLDTINDKTKYQSAEYAFIAFDELTQFPESDYRYLFSRLRRLQTSRFPMRMRGATNPGGVGGDWVYRRFLVEGPSEGRLFIPSLLDDNPHIDRYQYVQSLMNLDPVTREQLLRGDWTVRHAGSIFRREWFQIIDVAPPTLARVRAWDLAATVPKKGYEDDPDYTAGVKMGRDDVGNIFILDVRHFRATPQGVDQAIKQTAQMDGRDVPIFIEQEGGAAGVFLADHYLRMLAGWTYQCQRPSGDKVARASPLSSYAEGGRVFLLRAPWNGRMLDEFEAFPVSKHDDIVDAAAYAFQLLTDTTGGGAMQHISMAAPKQPHEMTLANQNASGFGVAGPRDKRASQQHGTGGRWKMFGA